MKILYLQFTITVIYQKNKYKNSKLYPYTIRCGFRLNSRSLCSSRVFSLTPLKWNFKIGQKRVAKKNWFPINSLKLKFVTFFVSVAHWSYFNAAWNFWKWINLGLWDFFGDEISRIVWIAKLNTKMHILLPQNLPISPTIMKENLIKSHSRYCRNLSP